MPIPTCFEFECPVKTHCGDRALENIPFELRAMNAAKPLVIGDEPAAQEKRLGPVLNAFENAEMTLGIVEEIPVADLASVAAQLAAIYRDKDCDAVVAVGQGPFIDMAKWLNLMVSTGEDNPDAFIEGKGIPRSLKPLAVIPSARADGLELSGYVRLQDKILRSVSLMPPLLFIDSRSVGHPGDVALAETGLTALTLALEAMFNTDANPMTAVYARTAAKLAAMGLNDLAGGMETKGPLALTVAHAAALAGCTLGAGPRPLSYKLGCAVAETGALSAAQAMGVMLSYVLEHRSGENGMPAEMLLELLDGAGRLARTPKGQRGASGFHLLRDLLNRLFETTDGRIRRTLGDSGLSLQDVKDATDGIAAPGRGDASGDREVIVAHAWEGRPI